VDLGAQARTAEAMALLFDSAGHAAKPPVLRRGVTLVVRESTAEAGRRNG